MIFLISREKEAVNASDKEVCGGAGLILKQQHSVVTCFIGPNIMLRYLAICLGSTNLATAQPVGDGSCTGLSGLLKNFKDQKNL